MRARSVLLPVGAALLVFLELLAYTRGGAAALLASRLWVVHGLLFLGASLVVVLRSLSADVRRRKLLGVLALCWVGGLVLYPVASTERLAVNADGTQQVAAGLQNLAKTDLGYTEHAFLGYPSRQYLPLAVLPRIFGRSVEALRLGAAILVLLGLGVFAAGMKAQFDSEVSPEIAGLSLLALVTFPYLAGQLPFYDQTILPFAFVCHAVGWLALTWARFTAVRLLAALWSIAMLATGYTPGLAAWLLFLVFLLWQAARRWPQDRPEALAWASGALWCAGIGAGSFLTRIDLHAGDAGALRSIGLGRAARTAEILLFGSPVFFWSPLLMFPILFVLLLALGGRDGLPRALVAAWSVAVIFIATQLEGYMPGSVEFDLHRAIIVVPLVVGLLALRARDLVEQVRWRTPAAWITAALMAGFSGHLFSRAWRISIPSTAREAFLSDLERERAARGWSSDRRFALGILSHQAELADVETLAAYFWPAARVVRTDRDLKFAVAEGRDFVVYADRGYGLPVWVEDIRDSRVDIDLRGEHFPLEIVRASGSATEDWVDTRGPTSRLETRAIQIAGQRVRIRYSPADIGSVENLFDSDGETLLRTRDATTAILDLELERPRSLAGVSIWTGTMNVGLRVVLHATTGTPRSFETTRADAGDDPKVELRFPSRQDGVRRIRLEIANLQGGDGHIHIREVRLID